MKAHLFLATQAVPIRCKAVTEVGLGIDLEEEQSRHRCLPDLSLSWDNQSLSKLAGHSPRHQIVFGILWSRRPWFRPCLDISMSRHPHAPASISDCLSPNCTSGQPRLLRLGVSSAQRPRRRQNRIDPEGNKLAIPQVSSSDLAVQEDDEPTVDDDSFVCDEQVPGNLNHPGLDHLEFISDEEEVETMEPIFLSEDETFEDDQDLILPRYSD
ncbi:hypothetical protein ACFE04_029407 [Oxalis oulophora]